MTISEKRQKLRETINNMLNFADNDYLGRVIYQTKAQALINFAREIRIISRQELLRYCNNIRDKEPIL